MIERHLVERILVASAAAGAFVLLLTHSLLDVGELFRAILFWNDYLQCIDREFVLHRAKDAEELQGSFRSC